MKAANCGVKFGKSPYTEFQEANLDWLSQIRRTVQQSALDRDDPAEVRPSIASLYPATALDDLPHDEEKAPLPGKSLASEIQV